MLWFTVSARKQLERRIWSVSSRVQIVESFPPLSSWGASALVHGLTSIWGNVWKDTEVKHWTSVKHQRQPKQGTWLICKNAQQGLITLLLNWSPGFILRCKTSHKCGSYKCINWDNLFLLYFKGLWIWLKVNRNWPALGVASELPGLLCVWEAVNVSVEQRPSVIEKSCFSVSNWCVQNDR